MIIDENLLLENGACYENYTAKEIIFNNGDAPHFYLQIIQGTVELNNYHEDGKECTLNILSNGQAIGESLLFGENKYPMNAVAKTDCTILKLTKANFMQLLCKNNHVVLDLFRYLSDRLFYKYVMLFNNSSSDPAFKIQALMDYYKSVSRNEDQYGYALPLTRQQIANLTAMRVETVIRTVKKMESANMIQIKHGKVYY